jgi:phosphoribosylaminoimidazolecarboxamide formyltransferase/IMP cyclohydrolase
VVLAKNGQTLGIGTGNTSRVDSLRCAIAKAKRFGFDLKGRGHGFGGLLALQG